MLLCIAHVVRYHFAQSTLHLDLIEILLNFLLLSCNVFSDSTMYDGWALSLMALSSSYLP